MGKKTADLTGQRFGRWTVISFAGRNEHGHAKWLCRCDCGSERIVFATNLTRGLTKSCGCYQKERASECHTTHGGRHTRLYNIWCIMRARCANPRNPEYVHYGKRGIRVCDEWLNSFEEFREWALANGYKDELSIDRIDVNGDYCPANCRWATDEEQANNKTNNHFYTINGKTQTLPQHVRDSEINIHNLNGSTVESRIFLYGWTLEEAFSIPKGGKRNNHEVL